MVTKKTRFIALAIALLLVAVTGVVACDGKKEETFIDVFAASSLTDCMQDIGAKFNEKNPTINVRFISRSLSQSESSDVLKSGSPLLSAIIFFSSAHKSATFALSSNFLGRDILLPRSETLYFPFITNYLRIM